MDTAIQDYYNSSLRAKVEPLAIAMNYTGKWTIGGEYSERDTDSGYVTFAAGA